MLALWTDKLEVFFHHLVRPIEFSKIIGLSILSFAGIRILIWFLNKNSFDGFMRKRLVYASILTFTISVFLYIDYSIKVYNVLCNATRQSLLEKIEYSEFLAHGTKADSLNCDEYNILMSLGGFPDVPRTASNISYLYAYDGFLPDYTFQLSYEVPIETDIEELTFTKGRFSKSQTVQLKDGIKLVTYEEGLW